MAINTPRPPFLYLSLSILAVLYIIRWYSFILNEYSSNVFHLKDVISTSKISNTNALLGSTVSGPRHGSDCVVRGRRSECECWSSIGHRLNNHTRFGDHSKSGLEPLLIKEENGVIVNEFVGELIYELSVVLPMVYYYYLNNMLISSSSCGDMSPFYFFSRNHTTIGNCERTIEKNRILAYESELGSIHEIDNKKNWVPAPLKRSFCGCDKLWNKIHDGSKLVIITNKIIKEWHGQPIHFINVSPLLRIVSFFLRNDFLVIYHRPKLFSSLDHSRAIMRNSEFHALTNFFHSSKNMIFMESIAKRHPELSLNEVVVRTMAKSRCFISVRGEPAILSSYFGGWNILLAKKGGEFNDYKHLYHRFSGARVDYVNTPSKLETHSKEMALSYQCTVH